ncbi:MAG: helix-turn-helix transcriptional regulator [bacterium]|nr:helix-turn-helix transcriptional regulator [bacterium]
MRVIHETEETAEHSRKLRDEAAAESLMRIRRDRSRVPPRLDPLLAYIEEHLFDPTLDVNQLKRGCNIRDNSVLIRFHSTLGRTPHAYIEDRRLETACRLLSETSLRIWQVAELVGYSGIQVFSRAFMRWSGERPTAYRKKRRSPPAAEPRDLPAAPEPENLLSAESFQKAINGELPPGEANALTGRLLHRHPAQEGRKASRRPQDVEKLAAAPAAVAGLERLPQPLSREEMAELQAEELWNELREGSPPRQQELLHHRLRLITPALVHRLCSESRKAGRDDHQMGIRVARLAIEAVDVLDKGRCGDEVRTPLKVKGWAELSNAHRAAMDFASSEKAMAVAEDLCSDQGIDRRTRASVVSLKASLRRDQRRFAEAHSLVDEAISLARLTERPALIARHLINKATIHNLAGEPAAGISVLEEALVLIRDTEEEELLLAAYFNLVVCYVDAGRIGDAARQLPTIRRYYREHGQLYQSIRFRWLEGRVTRDLEDLEAAETAFLDARAAFLKMEDYHDAALVCLDLADLYIRQKRPSELQELTSSLVPLFNTLKLRGEKLLSFKILCGAVESREATAALVENVRVHLQDSSAVRERSERPTRDS